MEISLICMQIREIKEMRGNNYCHGSRTVLFKPVSRNHLLIEQSTSESRLINLLNLGREHQTGFRYTKCWSGYEPRHDKTNKVTVRLAKTQISLGIRPVWLEFSLCAQRVAKGPRFLHADSENSDQTGRMPRLIWVFAGRTVSLLVLSCRGSYIDN